MVHASINAYDTVRRSFCPDPTSRTDCLNCTSRTLRSWFLERRSSNGCSKSSKGRRSKGTPSDWARKSYPGSTWTSSTWTYGIRNWDSPFWEPNGNMSVFVSRRFIIIIYNIIATHTQYSFIRHYRVLRLTFPRRAIHGTRASMIPTTYSWTTTSRNTSRRRIQAACTDKSTINTELSGRLRWTSVTCATAITERSYAILSFALWSNVLCRPQNRERVVRLAKVMFWRYEYYNLLTYLLYNLYSSENTFENQNNSTDSCLLAGQQFRAGSSWHPYLPPNGFDTCTLCHCNVCIVYFISVFKI